MVCTGGYSKLEKKMCVSASKFFMAVHVSMDGSVLRRRVSGVQAGSSGSSGEKAPMVGYSRDEDACVQDPMHRQETRYDASSGESRQLPGISSSGSYYL